MAWDGKKNVKIQVNDPSAMQYAKYGMSLLGKFQNLCDMRGQVVGSDTVMVPEGPTFTLYVNPVFNVLTIAVPVVSQIPPVEYPLPEPTRERGKILETLLVYGILVSGSPPSKVYDAYRVTWHDMSIGERLGARIEAKRRNTLPVTLEYELTYPVVDIVYGVVEPGLEGYYTRNLTGQLASKLMAGSTEIWSATIAFGNTCSFTSAYPRYESTIGITVEGSLIGLHSGVCHENNEGKHVAIYSLTEITDIYEANYVSVEGEEPAGDWSLTTNRQYSERIINDMISEELYTHIGASGSYSGPASFQGSIPILWCSYPYEPPSLDTSGLNLYYPDLGGFVVRPSGIETFDYGNFFQGTAIMYEDGKDTRIVNATEIVTGNEWPHKRHVWACQSGVSKMGSFDVAEGPAGRFVTRGEELADGGYLVNHEREEE